MGPRAGPDLWSPRPLWACCITTPALPGSVQLPLVAEVNAPFLCHQALHFQAPRLQCLYPRLALLCFPGSRNLPRSSSPGGHPRVLPHNTFFPAGGLITLAELPFCLSMLLGPRGQPGSCGITDLTGECRVCEGYPVAVWAGEGWAKAARFQLSGSVFPKLSNVK